MTFKKTAFYTFSLLALAACGNKQSGQMQQGGPVSVTTMQVMPTDNAAYYDEYPATLVALNQSEIRPQVTGYITGIYFKDGAQVVKGQKLYSIDRQTYQANYDAALANVGVQQTNFEKAQKDADRYHELGRQDAIAKQQVDYADAALATAKQQLEAAKANADAVKASVGFATIYAPFSGTIGISQVRMGTSVVAGQTILNTISTDNPIAVDFTINQDEIYHFTQLQNGHGLTDSTFSLSFGKDVYPQYGKLFVMDRAVDPQTGSLKVRLTFPNDKGMLKAGMSATVRVLNPSSEQATIIPYKAITEQLGEFFVYVVGDSSKVTQRKVSLGENIGKDIIIKEGLHTGETIVVEGVQNLKEGNMITTDTASKKRNP